MRIVYMGTGEIGIPTLTALLNSTKHEVVAVVTQPDRPAGRNLEIRPPLVKTLALEKGLTVLQPERLRADPQPVLALAPDLIVVMAYGQILTKPILQLPKLACLNLHASLLPRHRGASPIHAALREGDTETGITVMYMDEGLDSGDILLMERISISPRETGGGLHDRLAQLAPIALIKALDLLEQGTAPRLPQDLRLVTYAPKLTKEDAIVDWHESAEVLDRRIRAMHPWPGTFCWWTKAGVPQRLRILEAEPLRQGYRGEGIPGEILQVGEEGIEVQTSSGSLLLRQLQLEGRKCMSAAEFARGYSLTKGALLK